MTNIIEFKPKKKSSEFERIDELFSLTVWVGNEEEYEIDMLCHEDYDEHDIFIALGCVFLKFGEENGLIEHSDEDDE